MVTIDLALVVRTLREARYPTQVALARAAGLHVNTLLAIEGRRGRGRVDMATIRALAAALDVPVSFLLAAEGTLAMPPPWDDQLQHELARAGLGRLVVLAGLDHALIAFAARRPTASPDGLRDDERRLVMAASAAVQGGVRPAARARRLAGAIRQRYAAAEWRLNDDAFRLASRAALVLGLAEFETDPRMGDGALRWFQIAAAEALQIQDYPLAALAYWGVAVGHRKNADVTRREHDRSRARRALDDLLRCDPPPVLGWAVDIECAKRQGYWTEQADPWASALAAADAVTGALSAGERERIGTGLWPNRTSGSSFSMTDHLITVILDGGVRAAAVRADVAGMERYSALIRVLGPGLTDNIRLITVPFALARGNVTATDPARVGTALLNWWDGWQVAHAQGQQRQIWTGRAIIDHAWRQGHVPTAIPPLRACAACGHQAEWYRDRPNPRIFRCAVCHAGQLELAFD